MHYCAHTCSIYSRTDLNGMISRHHLSDHSYECPSLCVSSRQCPTRCRYTELCPAKSFRYRHRIHCSWTNPRAYNSTWDRTEQSCYSAGFAVLLASIAEAAIYFVKCNVTERCPSVRLSHALQYCIKTNKASVIITSPSESPKPLTFEDVMFIPKFSRGHSKRERFLVSPLNPPTRFGVGERCKLTGGSGRWPVSTLFCRQTGFHAFCP